MNHLELFLLFCFWIVRLSFNSAPLAFISNYTQNEFVKDRPVDVEFLFALEKEVNEVFNSWVRGVDGGYNGLQKGRRYGRTILRHLNTSAIPRDHVILTVKIVRSNVKDRLKKFMDRRQVEMEIAEAKEIAERIIEILWVEKCFWRGMLDALEE